MKIEKTNIDDLIVIKPRKFDDNRGWFSETYNKIKLDEVGIKIDFIQDNHSFSNDKGTIRGLHFQNEPYAQSKLVRCTKGVILDVAVDLRKDSPTYLSSFSVELSAENQYQLFIPKGFAHGFLTLTDNVEVQYKVDNPYSKLHERSIRFDDPIFNINWGVKTPIMSEKDLNAPMFSECDIIL